MVWYLMAWSRSWGSKIGDRINKTMLKSSNSIDLFQSWLISPNIRQTGIGWTQGLTDVGSEEGMGWHDYLLHSGSSFRDFLQENSVGHHQFGGVGARWGEGLGLTNSLVMGLPAEWGSEEEKMKETAAEDIIYFSYDMDEQRHLLTGWHRNHFYVHNSAPSCRLDYVTITHPTIYIVLISISLTEL